LLTRGKTKSRGTPRSGCLLGDGWFTTTFTGTATITPYLDYPGLTMPDPSVLPLTGHLTEWFGASCNRSNVVFHSTLHFSGADANGLTLTVLDVSHANTTAAAPFGFSA
jgi:hypothetical protein